MFDGLLVAFFVGLLVNQITDLITKLKEHEMFINYYIPVTIGVSLFLFVICILIFAYQFISEILKILGEKKNAKD